VIRPFHKVAAMAGSALIRRVHVVCGSVLVAWERLRGAYRRETILWGSQRG
jgi:hypothetical protein